MLQFQHTLYDKKDFFKLICSIINALGEKKLKEDKLKATFEIWFSQLKDKLDALLGETTSVQPEQTTDKHEDVNQDILEELLELSRSQQKMIRNPEVLLPQEYFREMFNSLGFIDPNHRAWRDLEIYFSKLNDQIDRLSDEEITPELIKDIQEYQKRLGSPIRYILSKDRNRRSHLRSGKLWNE